MFALFQLFLILDKNEQTSFQKLDRKTRLEKDYKIASKSTPSLGFFGWLGPEIATHGPKTLGFWDAFFGLVFWTPILPDWGPRMATWTKTGWSFFRQFFDFFLKTVPFDCSLKCWTVLDTKLTQNIEKYKQKRMGGRWFRLCRFNLDLQSFVVGILLWKCCCKKTCFVNKCCEHFVV